jgi:hypothetical protein
VRLKIKTTIKRFSTSILACLVAILICSCSSPKGLTGSDSGEAPRITAELGFKVVNFTGIKLHAIYVSAHDSPSWEENVLGQDELLDSETLEINFTPEEKADAWDIRVEDNKGNNAQWQNLNLREISRITFRVSQNVVIAEAE